MSTRVRDLAHAHQPSSALEVASGLLFGSWPEAISLRRHGGPEPRAALEALVRPALATEPCVIGFSGGRDSSALLAVAVDLARREGWSEPVPVTLEYEGERTHEREWQERMVHHLRIADWVRLPMGYELDFLGPVATEVLRRHGLLFPANAHTVVPLARAASGGSVITGVGGDDTFGRWPWHDLGSLFAGRRAARAADLRRCAHALAPRRLRAEVMHRREPMDLPWLTPTARTLVARKLAHEFAGAPPSWSARMAWSARWRAWRAAARSLEVLGADHGVEIHSPFLHPDYFAALARAGGRCGWGDRTATMRALFGDLLPEVVVGRTTKAEFGEPFFGEHTRRFAARWDGRAGLDATLVDGEELRRTWTSEHPHGMSAVALQAAWLAT